MKNQAQRAQQQIRAQASPSGTACLIGKELISLAPHKRSPASSRSPWSAKTSQMGVLYPATPKIYNFPPQFPPNVPPMSPTASASPDHCFWHCLQIFTSAPNPYPTAPPYYTPPPSHPAPSAYQLTYPPNQKTLLLILTSHGTTAILCFFGWWGIPGVDL
jgi:hypothetical protein